MAACLCWGGWFEEYGIMLSGFLYMEVIHFVGALRIIIMSKKNVFGCRIPLVLLFYVFIGDAS